MAVRRFPLYLAVIAGAVVMVLPFYWMVVTAVSPATDVIAFPPKWVPSYFTLEHFKEAWARVPWLVYYKNSLVVAAGCTALGLAVGLPAAYSIARWRQQRLAVVILSSFLCSCQPLSIGSAHVTALRHKALRKSIRLSSRASAMEIRFNAQRRGSHHETQSGSGFSAWMPLAGMCCMQPTRRPRHQEKRSSAGGWPIHLRGSQRRIDSRL